MSRYWNWIRSGAYRTAIDTNAGRTRGFSRVAVIGGGGMWSRKTGVQSRQTDSRRNDAAISDALSDAVTGAMG